MTGGIGTLLTMCASRRRSANSCRKFVAATNFSERSGSAKKRHRRSRVFSPVSTKPAARPLDKSAEVEGVIVVGLGRRYALARHGERNIAQITVRRRVATETKQRIAQLVVRERKLIAGNFSEPIATSRIGERPLKARARR